MSSKSTSSKDKSLSWAVGNRHIWSHLKEHVRPASDPSHRLSITSCMFILGASGIGKTYHTKRLLEEHEVYTIDASNCANHKEFRDMLIKGCNPYLVTRTQSSKPFAILIDDIDILCSLDRTMITTLLDVLANKANISHVPIVCIGTLDMEKKLGKCKVFKCTAPEDTDIFMFLKANPLAYRKQKKWLMKIAEDCHGNLNRALDQLHGGISNSVPLSAKSERIAKMKNEMVDDPWMMPLRYHENLPKLFKHENQASTYQEVLPYFCTWDCMMNHSSVDPEMAVDILAHAICHYTGGNVDLGDFTKLLSNLSLQKKNERLMFPSWDHGFPWPHAQIFCEYSKQKWIT